MHLSKPNLDRSPFASGSLLPRRERNALPLLFVGFVTAVVIRFSIPSNVLNIFESYSSRNVFEAGSGSFLAKLHPGTYGIIVLTILMLPRIVAQWRVKDRDGVMKSMFIMSTAIMIAALICVFTKQTASIGYLIDNLFIACAAGSAAFCFTISQRRFLGNALLVVIVLSSVMAIAEFFSKKHFLPQDIIVYEGATSIRATGLSEHPLALGLYNAVAIPILYLTTWSRLVKATITVILVLAIFAAGARIAAISATMMIVLCLIFVKRPHLDVRSIIFKRALVIVGLLILAPIVWLIASSVGLTDRFQLEGLTDDSAMARIIIFQIFNYMDWNELIWGVGNFSLYKYTVFGTNMAFVENSLIAYVFQFGVIGAVCLVGALLNALIALGRHTELPLKLALFTFFVVTLSNNTLSSKSPALMMIFVLAVAFRDAVSTKRAVLPGQQGRRKRYDAIPAHVRPIPDETL